MRLNSRRQESGKITLPNGFELCIMLVVIAVICFGGYYGQKWVRSKLFSSAPKVSAPAKPIPAKLTPTPAPDPTPRDPTPRPSAPPADTIAHNPGDPGDPQKWREDQKNIKPPELSKITEASPPPVAATPTPPPPPPAFATTVIIPDPVKEYIAGLEKKLSDLTAKNGELTVAKEKAEGETTSILKAQLAEKDAKLTEATQAQTQFSEKETKLLQESEKAKSAAKECHKIAVAMGKGWIKDLQRGTPEYARFASLLKKLEETDPPKEDRKIAFQPPSG